MITCDLTSVRSCKLNRLFWSFQIEILLFEFWVNALLKSCLQVLRLSSVAYHGFLAPRVRSRFSAPFSDFFFTKIYKMEMVDTKLNFSHFQKWKAKKKKKKVLSLFSHIFTRVYTLRAPTTHIFCINRPTHSCTLTKSKLDGT